MAEQWISASQVSRLDVSTVAVCTRAHAGLIRTRARLLLVGKTRREIQDVPSEFWWANGQAALEQNWSIGDFSTWLDQKVHIQAFGVTFAAQDVVDMLAPERQAPVWRGFSVISDPDWLGSSLALQHVMKAAGVSSYDAESLIIENARLGFLTARAVEMQPLADLARSEGGQREWDIPSSFWAECMPTADWTIGRFTTRETERRQIALSGVHFLADSIASRFVAAIPVQPSPILRGDVGRPPAALSDEMMCAVWGAIYRGDLQPKTQAVVKEALLEWASANGQPLGETLAKDKARKIVAECRREVGNLPG